jgi:hypothetical protein
LHDGREILFDYGDVRGDSSRIFIVEEGMIDWEILT